MHTIARRTFLTSGLTAATLVASGATRSEAAEPAGAGTPVLTPDARGLTTYVLGPQIWIRWDNQLVTCYRAHRSQKYPYLYPLSGPLSGLSVTAESALPYPHHRSLLFACDRVNGGNYWQEDYDKGQILSTGPRVGTAATNTVEIVDTCEWQKPEGPIVMRDERRIQIIVADPRRRFIDWTIQWQAVEDVTIPKTNHSLFALRAAPDLTPLGGGQLVNAEGESGEKATFGRKSAWCDFSGRRAGIPGDIVEGIALLDHPQNPWAPTPWFTRDYGFISPSPLNFIDHSWQLAAGQAIQLRYRTVIHAGDAQDAAIAEVYQAWTQQA